MENIETYIQSGIIESYVLGLATEEEINEVNYYASTYPVIAKKIAEFELQIENIALKQAVQPDPVIKPFVMASQDYMLRLSQGEAPVEPPLLQATSSAHDYNEWLNRPDLCNRKENEDVYAKIIGYTPQAITAIVWLKHMAPQEVHHTEYERFLIVEGTCDITIGNQVHSLHPGDFLEIPLHVHHTVMVTSTQICKVILQRVAA